jgi:hypothetical protein
MLGILGFVFPLAVYAFVSMQLRKLGWYCRLCGFDQWGVRFLTTIVSVSPMLLALWILEGWA